MNWTVLSTIAIAIIPAAVASLITYLVTRPKQKADIKKTESDTDKTEAETEKLDIENTEKEVDILKEAKAAAVASFKAEIALEREKEGRARDNENNKFLLELADRENSKLDTKLERLREEFTLMKIDEGRCRGELEELKKFKEDQTLINERLTDYSDRNSQLTALVQEAHKQGFLVDSQLDRVNVEYDRR